jgi:hypothetical protein
MNASGSSKVARIYERTLTNTVDNRTYGPRAVEAPCRWRCRIPMCMTYT